MSGMLTIKLRRDLWASWSRFLMMTVAIAVTLTAVGAVLLAWAASARETRSAYMSTAGVDDHPARRTHRRGTDRDDSGRGASATRSARSGRPYAVHN